MAKKASEGDKRLGNQFKIGEEEFDHYRYPAKFTNQPTSHEGMLTNNENLIKNNIHELFSGRIEFNPKAMGINGLARSTITKARASFGEVYVINAIGTNVYKIGCTTNFKKRFTGITAASPLPIEIYKYGKCENPYVIEAIMHRRLKEFHFKNEWFILGEDELKIVERVWELMYLPHQ